MGSGIVTTLPTSTNTPVAVDAHIPIAKPSGLDADAQSQAIGAGTKGPCPLLDPPPQAARLAASSSAIAVARNGRDSGTRSELIG
ncbi:MAG: hypothetical protein AMXMBFR52_29660 [Burkholderiales bacterium]